MPLAKISEKYHGKNVTILKNTFFQYSLGTHNTAFHLTPWPLTYRSLEGNNRSRNFNFNFTKNIYQSAFGQET